MLTQLQVVSAPLEIKNEADVISEHDFPAYPAYFRKDLQANGCLYDDDTIASVMNSLKDQPDGRYSSKELKQEFGVIKCGDEYFAVHESENNNNLPLIDEKRKKKLAQSLITKKIYQLKIHDAALDEMFNENDTLNAMGEFVTPIFLRDKDRNDSLHLQGNVLTDYHGGYNLEEIYSLFYKLSPYRIMSIAAQAVAEIQKLHQKGFLHIDICANSFTYDIPNNKLKLTDFRYARPMDKKGQFQTTTLVSENHYSLDDDFPAMLTAGKVIYDIKSDVNALGGMLSELFGYTMHLNDLIEKDGEYTANFVEDHRATAPTLLTSNDEISRFLDKMMDEKRDARPNMQTVCQFFTDMKNMLVPITLTTTGIINIHEYAEGNRIFMDYFMAALRNFDEVVLVSFRPVVHKTLLEQIRADFAKHKIMLLDKYYVLPSTNSLELLQDKIDESSGDDIVRSYCYFSAKQLDNKNVNSFKFHCDNYHFSLTPDQLKPFFGNWQIEVADHVIRMLEVELETSEEGSSRYGKINDALLAIQKHRDARSLTYRVLQTKLDALQKSLQSPSHTKENPFSLFANNKTQKVVTELRTFLQAVRQSTAPNP